MTNWKDALKAGCWRGLLAFFLFAFVASPVILVAVAGHVGFQGRLLLMAVGGAIGCGLGNFIIGIVKNI